MGGCIKWKAFIGRKVGKGAISKREKKKKIALDQENEGREKQGLSFLLWEMESTPMAVHFIENSRRVDF